MENWTWIIKPFAYSGFDLCVTVNLSDGVQIVCEYSIPGPYASLTTTWEDLSDLFRQMSGTVQRQLIRKSLAKTTAI